MAEFKDLGLDEKLCGVLASLGFKSPSPVQEKAIPALLSGKSALIKAPTGSGKTLAYLLPILEDLDASNPNTEAVVIVPTDILAHQGADMARPFMGAYKDFSLGTVVSGEGQKEHYGEKIIFATPDLFLFCLAKMNLKYVKRMIIDEGDMILFGGFEEQLNQILSLDLKCAKDLFTASVDEHLNRLVRRFIGADTIIDLSEEGINAGNIEHRMVDIRHVEKPQALVSFLKAARPYKAIVFASKKSDLQAVDEALKNSKINHLVISGEMTKREQKRSYKSFDENKAMLLLATDIAARGVDLKDVTDVISLDLPLDISYYFHRAGRAGRFFKKGVSYVFYNNDDTSRAKELVRRGVQFTFWSLKGDELKEERSLTEIERRPARNNQYVEAAIKQRLRKLRGKKVMPCYKKKRRVAIELVKKYHKEDIIRRNMRERNDKEGTHYAFVSDRGYHGRKKKGRN
jgi:ATP-dependent RNA helicase CshB